jgi:hypothetical protein
MSDDKQETTAWVSTREAAAIAGRSQATIRRWARQNWVAARRTERRSDILVSLSDLYKVLAAPPKSGPKGDTA